MDCLFCKIVQQEIPAEIVYDSERILAFKDINPQAPHHILVIPRQHIATINDITSDDLSLVGEIVHTAKELAAELGIANHGYRILFNTNGDAGQVVFHIHLHLLGGRQLQWPPG